MYELGKKYINDVNNIISAWQGKSNADHMTKLSHFITKLHEEFENST